MREWAFERQRTHMQKLTIPGMRPHIMHVRNHNRFANNIVCSTHTDQFCKKEKAWGTLWAMNSATHSFSQVMYTCVRCDTCAQGGNLTLFFRVATKCSPTNLLERKFHYSGVGFLECELCSEINIKPEHQHDSTRRWNVNFHSCTVCRLHCCTININNMLCLIRWLQANSMDFGRVPQAVKVLSKV